ncbi:MAG: hypothetical protein K6E40_10035 [Desulfovibrio sp.]|nr:hypothetical protein [Desulfovibrio sp.]
MASHLCAFVRHLVLACLLLAGALSGPSQAREQGPAFTVALVGSAESLAGLEVSRDALRELSSKDLQERIGLSWHADITEHLAQGQVGMEQAVRSALARNPSLVVCADVASLRTTLASRTPTTPVFVPDGVTLNQLTQSLVDGNNPPRLYIHIYSSDIAPKLAKAVQFLGAKRVGMLYLANASEGSLPYSLVAHEQTAKALGCELITVPIAEDSSEACRKGMATLAELSPDFAFLWHLDCFSSEGLGDILDPLYKARIPAVGGDSVSEALGGALLAFFQRLRTQQRRNAYQMLRILFADSVPIPELSMTAELAVNMEAASILSLHLPMEVLIEADYIFWKTRNWPAY